MRILVTGGAGFIGSHTVNYLLDAGDEVLVIDDLSRGHMIPPKPAEFIQTDIFSEDLPKVWQNFRPEVVLHLAAQIDVQFSWESPSEDLRKNAQGTLRLLELSRNYGPAKFILSSSAAVYGPSSGILSENSPIMPCSPYGISKRVAEDYLALWATRWGIPWLVLRYANVYGPYSQDINPVGVCRIFARNLKQGLPLIVHGSGKQMRDFVSVYDVAKANYLACHSTVSEEVVNISSGEGHTILEVLNILVEVSGKSPQIHFLTDSDPGVKQNVLSAKRAKVLLNWAADWNLTNGLVDLWEKTARE